MANRIVNDTSLTSVANAIREKAGTSGTMAFPAGFVSAIGNIPTGGGGATDGDVIFIDYDGTVVDAKTKAQINAMTSDSDLPANPTHTGLTAQGWNWTVTQLKAQLTAMPDQKVYVGQMYVTTSGATEIDVEMHEGRLDPVLTIAVNGEVSVDWGDNTTPDTVTGTSETTILNVDHTYASEGNYTISIFKVSGSYALMGSSSYTILRKNTTTHENKVYATCIRSIRIGTGITVIKNYAFCNCYALASITIPSSITNIEYNAFQSCYSLASITIPSGITSIKSSALYCCYSLTSITIPSSVTSIEGSAVSNCCSLASITIPSGVASIGGSAFYGCYSLASVTIPSGVTSIGGSTFCACYSLASVTIPSGVTSIGNNAFQYCYILTSITLPSSVTSIGSQAFYYCYSLASITIPSGVTSIGSSAFYNCYSLASITIPSKVTSIGEKAFYYCCSLTSITIQSNVTSISSQTFYNCNSLASITIPSNVTSIGSSAFYGCYSLASITIPSDVISIGNTAFQNCYGVKEYHFKSTSVPTAGTTIFSSIVSDTVIYIPYSSDHSILNAYKTASNWSTYASYMQEEPS